MLLIHLTKPPSQGAEPHCVPTGLSLRGCGHPEETMPLAVCAEVFLGSTSDHSIPWQQKASYMEQHRPPSLIGGQWAVRTGWWHLEDPSQKTGGKRGWQGLLRTAPGPAPTATSPAPAPTCSATSLLMASASCSCSSSSPLVWGRACSSSEDTLGEVAAGERQSHHRQRAGSRSTVTGLNHTRDPPHPPGSCCARRHGRRAGKVHDYCKVKI